VPQLDPFITLEGALLEAASIPEGCEVFVSVMAGRILIEALPIPPEPIAHLEHGPDWRLS